MPGRPAPPEIQFLILLANSVPPDFVLPHDDVPAIAAALHRLEREKQFAEFRGFADFKRTVRLLASPQPRHPRTNVAARHLSKRQLADAYVLVHGAREMLRWLAALPPTPGRHILPATHSQVVEIDAHGVLHFDEYEWFTRCIEGVEVKRIRMCLLPKCKRIFWAKTLGKRDMKGCCPRHSASIKMKRLREEHPEKYKR
jgi:hypothetical protein